MMFHTLMPLLALALSAATSSALRIPFQRAKRSPTQRRGGNVSIAVSHVSTAVAGGHVLAAASNSNPNAFDINTVHDLIYIANITVGGTVYPVQMDTGSSDLWIKGPSSPLSNSNETSQTYNLSYGIGWAYGHVSYAPVQFAGISVPQQAFLDSSNAQNPALSYGAEGIAGFGFTSLSTIDALVNMTNSSSGRSLLYNLFLDNPQEPNFIAFSLQRSSDQNDTADGSFSIGQYDPRYQSIANTSPIPTFPETSPNRWSVLVDSVIVGSNQVSVTTSVANAPGNKAVALLDSGTSYSYAPTEICQAIYGGVTGAKYDSSLGQWIVPCDAEIDMALQINDQVYPLHPLDVSTVSLTNSSTCVGSFLPQAVSVGQGEFDWLIGDNFLRSVYSIYDFGDFDSSGKMGSPYVKLLSLVDPTQASVDFHNIRGGTPNYNITYNTSNVTDSSTTVSLSADVAQVLDKIGKFFPAMLAVVAFNALILLVLIIIGVALMCKKRGTKVPRKTRGRMSPVPLNHTSRFVRESTHAYQPVSMAMTEDTFVPPMPAFRGDTVRSKSSRKSSYSTIAPVSPTSAFSPASPSSAPEDAPFTSPGVHVPAFRSEVQAGDRPMSSFVQLPTTRQSFIPPDRPQSSYIPSANTPSNSQFIPPPAVVASELTAFISNIQPGDRPRSYMPAAVSPEDELFARPSAPFRDTDRPRSMA